MLPHLGNQSRPGTDSHGEAPVQRADQDKVSTQDLKRLGFLYTQEAMKASSRLYKLTEGSPEDCLNRSGLLIDTDPRHVGSIPLEELELPGVSQTPGQRPSSVPPSKSKQMAKRKESMTNKKETEPKPTVSYITADQMAAEEAALQDRILYEMRQNLQKLKEYGKEIGITFDISKKKSQHGRMQGEKWEDDELQVWKGQALRVLKPEEPENKKALDEQPQMERQSDYVFKLERIMNEMKWERQRRQAKKEKLENEIAVSAEQESREQSGAGKMADAFGRLSTLKERIQDTDQKILEEAAEREKLQAEHDAEAKEVLALRNQIEEVEKLSKDYDHDFGVLKLQLKDQLHEVEKVLGQGKLQTMMQVKEEIKSTYKEEVEARKKAIQKQVKVKEMLDKHEERVKEMTEKLQHQYDQNSDSPRRNELKRKAIAFEEVFDTMMKRIGESKVSRIVELFQKQTLTQQAWTESVRDQEIRVKALQDEKRMLEKQLLKVSSNKSHGISNQTRQYTISGRKLDMAVERLDNSSLRLMQLEGLIAHVKESVRQGLIRLQTLNKRVPVPPQIFAHEGDGGLIEWVDKYAEAVAGMQPKEEELSTLEKASDKIKLEPVAEEAESKPHSPGGTPIMPRKLKLAVSRAADDIEHVPTEKGEGGEELNRRIPFAPPRSTQKATQDKEREEDEQEARAEQLDESIASRDEIKRRAMRMMKQKERERADKDAIDKGEESPAKKKKKSRKAHDTGPGPGA